MGGRIRCGNGGAGCAGTIGHARTAIAFIGPCKGTAATIAHAWPMQAQSHAPDLQQSGTGAPFEALSGELGSWPLVACAPWWHGIDDAASAVPVTGVACIDAAKSVLPGGGACIACMEAIAVPAPLKTRATHSRRRNRMVPTDMQLLYSSDRLAAIRHHDAANPGRSHLDSVSGHGLLDGPEPGSLEFRAFQPWGHSSAGRAPAWHAGGRRFDPGWLHHLPGLGRRDSGTKLHRVPIV